MNKKTLVLAILWALVCIVVTGWVQQEAAEVTFGNALLVGAVAASVITAAAGSLKLGK